MNALAQNQSITTGTTSASQDMFDIMDKAIKFSEIIAKSDIIPLHYRNKPANIFIALQTAYRKNLDFMLFMQNSYVSNGQLQSNSSFAIALANSSGLLKGGIKFKIDNFNKELKANYTYYDKSRNKLTGTKILQDMDVTAYATLKSTNEEISFKVGMKHAAADGWISNSKYETLPELMLCYRAAMFLIKTHIPEVLNGLQVIEEVEDIMASKPDKSVYQPKIMATEKLADFLASAENDFLTTAEEEITAPEITLVDNHEKLINLIELYQIPQETVEKWCQAGAVESIDQLDEDKIQSCIEYIESKIKLKV